MSAHGNIGNAQSSIGPRTAKIENGDMTGVLGGSFTIDGLGKDNFCHLARYESSIVRAFYRASKVLQTLQKTRIGFVRQNNKQPEPSEQSAEPVPVAVPAQPISARNLRK